MAHYLFLSCEVTSFVRYVDYVLKTKAVRNMTLSITIMLSY
jgi:hypothetical protein